MGVLAGVACTDFSNRRQFNNVNVRKTSGGQRCVWKPIPENKELLDYPKSFKKNIQPLPRKSLKGPAPLPPTTPFGWLRIYCGPVDQFNQDILVEPNRIISCDYTTTTTSILNNNMKLPSEYTIWMQIGGSLTEITRLQENDRPYQIQDEFFKKLGYTDLGRRSRLEIDLKTKYLIRFFVGPAEIPFCENVKKSGNIDILKGLVFPQWKKRNICIVGNKLFLFPASKQMNPEIINLHGADIIESISLVYERLILKIIPKIQYSENFFMKDNLKLNYKNFDISQQNNNNGSASSVYNSSGSLSSVNCVDRDKVIFFGFEESWERDIWNGWLLEASTEPNDAKRLDIGNSNLQTIPEVVLQSIEDIEELLAGQNKLQEIGLKALSQFPQLQILRLPGNGFTKFPPSLLDITALTVLDLTDNSIDVIPDEIMQLTNLEELRIDRNEVKVLPNSLRFLRNLKSLQASQNQINCCKFLIRMRTTGLVDMYATKPSNDVKLCLNNGTTILGGNPNQIGIGSSGTSKTNSSSLTKVSLRANQLRGNIILGNYGNLTQLDVSENDIEILDLSALGQLESLQCCRNKLVELTVNGGCLSSLITGNNEIRKLTVTPTPVHLRHLDVGFNKLTELPQWLSGCHQLRTLFANNNRLRILPEHLFCSDLNALHTLQLGYNEIIAIPTMPKRKLPIQELFLQSNEIETLPKHFFYACENLVLLNISSNKLQTLPSIPKGCATQLERVFATKNSLHDRIWETLIHFRNLRILHAAYNQLTKIPDDCFRNWPELEELVLSGNSLQHLPDSLAQLKNLKILRIHSNKLQSTPQLAKTKTLRVLDLAHNQLDKINLMMLVPKKLQFLDLSCNLQLQVDEKQLQVCRSQRPMSLVDVSGKNRSSLPTTSTNLFDENCDFEPPWKVGFSETAGGSPKLYVSQLRLPNFCNSESLFGIFDGEINNVVPGLLVKMIPKILLEERTIKETANEYMKYTLLSAHRELRHNGQKYGVCATLTHISREKITNDFVSNAVQGRKYILRVASVGEASAYLIRKTSHVKLTPNTPNRQIGNSAQFPTIVPNPEVSEITLCDQDEYLIICNKKLWEIMDIDIVTKEIRSEENVILAAKRVQDIAQSFGAEENLSVIILKFNNLGTDVDTLIRDLRQTIRNKPGGIMSGFCKCGCCCESNNNCCHSTGSNQFIRQFSSRSDRSSPSGQSDQAASELNLSKPQSNAALAATRKLNQTNRNLKNGIARAVRARIDEEIDETDSALSEEQFKCWEYMLEQNTHILFDKELNTISKAFTKNRNYDKSASNLNLNNISKNLGRLPNTKILSASSPQLVHSGAPSKNNLTINNQQSNTNNISNSNPSFLSRHFGSARSFQPPTPTLFKSLKSNSGRLPPLGGSANAAYFGSLQRLMPYNLEYDFAVMHERNSMDDLEHEGRMRQYWGVATTEL